MHAITEKAQTLYGCRLGPTALRQLAHIAAEGLESPRISFSHTQDSTKFSAETLDDLLQVIGRSAVVADMSNCGNLHISINASDYFIFILARPESIYVTVRGPERTLVLGKFETLTGYLRGHGGTEQSVGQAQRPSLFVISTGIVLQLLIYAVGRFQFQYSVIGLIVNLAFTLLGYRMRVIAMERRKNVINAMSEPEVLVRGWSNLSLANRLAIITAIAAVVATVGTVASAAADWFK
jgi:hypothetical protein